MSDIFDFEKAIAGLRSGKDLVVNEGVLMPLIKQLAEAAITDELEYYLAKGDEPNRKNGKTSKTVKTGSGLFELDTPRDHAGNFEPQLVKKN
jgi:putative transposase